MNAKINELEKRITKIKKEIINLDEMRPGSLSEQYNVCGTPICKCKADPPQKHGPYFQISFTRKGKSGSQFVKKHEVDLVKQQMKNYSKFKELTEKWVDLSWEISKLKILEERKKN